MNNRSGFCLTVLYLLGTSILYMGNNYYHAHLALLTSYVLFIPIIYIFSYLRKKYQNDNLYNMLGKSILGKILGILLIIYTFFLGSRVMFRYVDFMEATSLFIGNKIIFIISLLLIVSILALKNLRILGRFSLVSFFLIIMCITFLFLFGIPNMTYDNLLPLYPYYFNDYIKNVIIFLTDPFLEAILLLNVVNNNRLIKGFSTAFFILFIMLIEAMMLLGSNFSRLMVFPIFSSIGVISAFEFINRIEVLGVIIFYLTCIVKISVIIIAIRQGIIYYFNLRKKYYIVPISIIIVFLSSFYKSNLELLHYQNLFIYLGGAYLLLLILYLLIKKRNN